MGMVPTRSHSFTAPTRVLDPPATVRETAKTGIHTEAQRKNTKQTQFLASRLQSMSYGWFCAPRARLAKHV